MPRQLPGMRWDHEKQRYFPLTSAAPSRSQHQTRITQVCADTGSVDIKRHRGPLASYNDLRSVWRTAHKDALIHQIRSSQIPLTDRTVRSTIPLQGLVSAFQTVRHCDRVCCFVGDDSGWFYSSVVDMHHEEMDTIDPWQRQYNLSSEVSSIATSSTACVATSFGPECTILYVPLDAPIQDHLHVSRIDSRIAHDVWTTDLLGSRLVLGANKQAVMIDDIALCTPLHRLPTKSDVFSLAQRENVLYTGLRNGGILRFDTRVQRSNSCPLFDDVSKPTSSIVGLKHLRDHQLLASFLDGGMSTFDLRFPIRTPLMTFTGNFNSYTNRLPLATDPYEKFLFAAGQDNRIRLWSLSTGGSALCLGGTCLANQSVFERPFKHRVAALQVVEEREGLCLWAASGTELCKYTLGHRSGIGI